MILFLGIAIIIVVYISFGYITYLIWKSFFNATFETFNKRMEISSIILGILCPISSLVLITIVLYAVCDFLNDYIAGKK